MSEIARLREQITLEYEAAQRGMSGLSCGNARHDFIRQKYDAMGQCTDQLVPLVGRDEAYKITIEAMNSASEQAPQSKKGEQRA